MKSVFRALPVLTRALAACAFLLGLGASMGCPSRCSSDLDCVKQCPCSDGANCSVGLSCVNTFCEIEETPICQVPEDFCDKYQSKNLCGSKKCERNADCRKTCQCVGQFNAPNQNPVNCNFECKRSYSCLEDEGMCDTTYAAESCDEICGAAIPQDSNCTAPPPSTAGSIPFTECRRRSTSPVPTPGT